MGSSARKDLLGYWRGIMKDKRESKARRDEAAKEVLKILTIASRNKRLVAMEKRRRTWDKVLERGTKAVKRDAFGSTDKTRGKPGKKDLKKEAADETATNNEWSGLIPSAQVIPLRQKRGK